MLTLYCKSLIDTQVEQSTYSDLTISFHLPIYRSEFQDMDNTALIDLILN